MQASLVQLRAAKVYRRKAAQTKAVTFVTGVGLVAGGAGLTATGVGESLLTTFAHISRCLASKGPPSGLQVTGCGAPEKQTIHHSSHVRLMR